MEKPAHPPAETLIQPLSPGWMSFRHGQDQRPARCGITSSRCTRARTRPLVRDRTVSGGAMKGRTARFMETRQRPPSLTAVCRGGPRLLRHIAGIASAGLLWAGPYADRSCEVRFEARNGQFAVSGPRDGAGQAARSPPEIMREMPGILRRSVFARCTGRQSQGRCGSGSLWVRSWGGLE